MIDVLRNEKEFMSFSESIIFCKEMSYTFTNKVGLYCLFNRLCQEESSRVSLT